MPFVVINVTGKPVPWARTGGHGKIRFTPARVRAWENDARQLARDEMGIRRPTEAVLRFTVIATFEVSASWPEWKRALAHGGVLGHSKVPDYDNLLKASSDALNKVVYKDDAQICNSVLIKQFGEYPSVRIIVEELPLIPCNIKRKPLDLVDLMDAEAWQVALAKARGTHGTENGSSARKALKREVNRQMERAAVKPATDAEIKEFEAKHDITKCPPAYAAPIQDPQPLGRLPHIDEEKPTGWKNRDFDFERKK